jgi:hypothetical protein
MNFSLCIGRRRAVGTADARSAIKRGGTDSTRRVRKTTKLPTQKTIAAAAIVPRLLTVKDAAAYLSASPWAIRKTALGL